MYNIKLMSDSKFVKEFIEKNHYSHKIPQAIKFRFGMYDNEELLGVAIFSVPANRYTITSIFEGCTQHIGIELSRVYTHDETPRNFESSCISKMFKYIKHHTPFDVVVSYADSNFGHAGYLYQALSGLYIGKTASEVRYITKDGELITRRGLGRKKGDTESAHAKRLINDGAKKVKMDGKYKYLFFTCNKRVKKHLLSTMKKQILEYPKL